MRAAALHNQGMVIRRSAAPVKALVVLVVLGAIGVGCSRKDDTASGLPRPSRAFCKAAADYDKRVGSPKLTVPDHIRYTKAIAQTAPVDIRKDANLVWRSFVKLEAGDTSVVDNPRVKDAIDHVNRRAGQDCGWFRRKEGGI